jgi:hypothetical protein
MERELGEEMTRAFRSRLRRIYNEDNQDMPAEIARVLMRLQDAEARIPHAGAANQSSCGQSDDGSPAAC